jgi:nitronate monooxygenase
LLFTAKLEDAAAVIEKHRPAAVWFSVPSNPDDYVIWTEKVREVSPLSKIWIQTGTVDSALQIAKTCKPDVLVTQGSDAGGHGYERSAGVISLLPETADTLKANGFSNIALVASGGIVDGRGLAAAITLGAEGVVMGTRFLAASETPMHPSYRKRILETTDGSQNTVRDTIFDELRGKNIWPAGYDGRAVVNDSYTEFKSGTSREDIQKLYAETEKDTEKGFGFEKGKARAAVWAGSGIGLVNKVQPAGEIVRETRAAARKVLSAAANF